MVKVRMPIWVRGYVAGVCFLMIFVGGNYIDYVKHGESFQKVKRDNRVGS
jgi:hypothetical protein